MAYNKVEFSSAQMLSWMGYISDMHNLSPEKSNCLTLAARGEIFLQQ